MSEQAIGEIDARIAALGWGVERLLKLADEALGKKDLAEAAQKIRDARRYATAKVELKYLRERIERKATPAAPTGVTNG